MVWDVLVVMLISSLWNIADPCLLLSEMLVLRGMRPIGHLGLQILVINSGVVSMMMWQNHVPQLLKSLRLLLFPDAGRKYAAIRCILQT
jgi:hypothetical protein